MENLKEVVIVSGARLPVGSFGGSLKDISAIDMGAHGCKRGSEACRYRAL